MFSEFFLCRNLCGGVVSYAPQNGTDTKLWEDKWFHTRINSDEKQRNWPKWRLFKGFFNYTVIVKNFMKLDGEEYM